MDKHIESQANFGTNGAQVYTMLHKVFIDLFYDLHDMLLQMVSNGNKNEMDLNEKKCP